MGSEILRIIEGGLTNDKRKIVTYSTKLADRLMKEGDTLLAETIREKLKSSAAKSIVMSDSLRNIPVDQDSRMQIVKVIPPGNTTEKIVLDNTVTQQIDEFIQLTNHQSDLELAGFNIPKTLLLFGKPGCGKTSIAHFISEKTDLPLVIARLDGIVSSLLGSTAKNLRKIFDYASSMPCILFLDEFDAIAKARDDSHELGELKRVINSLLQDIDGMPPTVVLIAATNHPELLDKAVWRRFTQQIEVGLPNKENMKEIVKLALDGYGSELKSDGSKMSSFCDALSGMSPSSVKTVINRAKIKSFLNKDKSVSLAQLYICLFELTAKDRNVEGCVHYLNKHGIPQTKISEYTKIPLRQVKNILSAN